MSLFESITDIVKERILHDSASMSEKEFFEAEIAAWKRSEKRRDMVDGERYYKGDHDILKRVRTAIGSDGKLKRVDNLPNNRIVNNQYQRLVNQKVNYLMGRSFTVDADNEEYRKELEKIFGKKARRTLKCLLRDAINYGSAWLYVYESEDGEFEMRRIPSYEILPFYKEGNDELDCVVRVYPTGGYRGKSPYEGEMAEIYKKDSVRRYSLENGTLIKDGEEYEEARIPLIEFRFNEKEIPLIKRVKGLQDALNETLSDLKNVLEEDVRNTILVLQNYDGTDLGEFRQNLAAYGAVKVRTVDGAAGDIRVLKTEADVSSFANTAEIIKNAMVENAMGCDVRCDKLGNNPNQLTIKSMYSDLDLDMSEAETEFKHSFDILKEFIDEYLKNSGRGYFSEERFDVVFNRDCLINEAEAIDNCVKSEGILSKETIVLQHPWVEDAAAEMKRIREGEKNGIGQE